jgi:hypothetical protein
VLLPANKRLFVVTLIVDLKVSADSPVVRFLTVVSLSLSNAIESLPVDQSMRFQKKEEAADVSAESFDVLMIDQCEFFFFSKIHRFVLIFFLLSSPLTNRKDDKQEESDMRSAL